MKTIAIGDIHGNSSWKDIVSKGDFDKVIFIGDYFDSFHIDGPTQVNNFRDIIEFKKNNLNKVILLIGNHDFHYLNVNERYSGFQEVMQFMLRTILEENLKYMQMCHVQDKILFVHAGVTKTWCKNNKINLKNIEQSINDLFTYRPFAFKFTAGEERNSYGDETRQTPIWVRPRSLKMDMIKNYTQVVGHTMQDRLKLDNRIILIDCLGTSGEYLKIVDGEMSAVKN